MEQVCRSVQILVHIKIGKQPLPARALPDPLKHIIACFVDDFAKDIISDCLGVLISNLNATIFYTANVRFSCRNHAFSSPAIATKESLF